MKNSFKNIGIVLYKSNNIDTDIENYIKEIINLLINDGIKVYLNNDIKYFFSNFSEKNIFIINKEDLGKYCDVVLSFGGDGTILTVARILAPFKIPIIGINKGSLGFLTQISADNSKQEILKILNGEYIKEERNLIDTSIIRDNKIIANYLALNEIACSRGSNGQMIETELFIDNEFVFRQRADGIIVSTPTGSTAYSLASGGPILEPTLQAITIVPVCPQSMSNRPIVIKNTSNIEILIIKGEDTKVYFDGHLNFNLNHLDKLEIKTYKNKLLMLNPVNYRYFNTLRQKLHWGEQLI